MRLSLVAMRVPARIQASQQPGPMLARPSELVAPTETAHRPEGVSAFAWEMLALHVDDARQRSSIAYGPLRLVVKTVVQELRTANASWDAVYAVLQSAVTPATDCPISFAAEYEMHTSRAAALVAHMHSWADVERLAELAADEATG